MKVAIVGSRSIHLPDLRKYLPGHVHEIISGGAKGIDTDARNYALSHNVPITEIYPDYRRFGKGAPLRRNLQIIDRADIVLIFWDGHSRGTFFVIESCWRKGIPFTLWLLQQDGTFRKMEPHQVMALEK